MKRENPFINRPVMAVSLSVVIVLVGCIALFTLPVQQYPDIAPPTVRVTATYTGADAEAVQQSVLVPLEESINGVEDMIYMTSTANNSGEATISVYFRQGDEPRHGRRERAEQGAEGFGVVACGSDTSGSHDGEASKQQHTDSIRDVRQRAL